MTFEKLKQQWIKNKAEQSRLSISKKQKLLKLAKGLFRFYGIREAYLFGSVTQHRARATSDIDLYVSPLANTEYWQFRFELEELLDMPVDLYTNHDDQVFVKKIIARGEKIYEV